jgi:hypothetical protein
MASKNRDFIPNQVFVGLPWKNVRARYERVLNRLELRFPLHFTIVGKNDGQSADDLFEIIKSRISESSVCIFDATGGNPNVSLEYGYAEGLEIDRIIYVSTHKAASVNLGSPIISDLGGKRRVQYKTEQSLLSHLESFARGHDYTLRYEKFVKKTFARLKKGGKKSSRTLALKVIHALDGVENRRHDDLVQRVQASGYEDDEVREMIRKLHTARLVSAEVGRYSRIRVT